MIESTWREVQNINKDAENTRNRSYMVYTSTVREEAKT